MAKEGKRKRITRRTFMKAAGAGALAAGVGPGIIIPGRSDAQQKTLKILREGVCPRQPQHPANEPVLSDRVRPIGSYSIENPRSALDSLTLPLQTRTANRPSVARP